MLKYQPKKFWGMIKNKGHEDIQVNTTEIVKYNKDIFYDKNIEAEEFQAIED
jgi:hypothetical protein